MTAMPNPWIDVVEIPAVSQAEPECIETAIDDIGEVSFGAPYPADVIEEILRGRFDPAAYTESDEQRYADLKALDDPRARDLAYIPDPRAVLEKIEPMPLFLRGAA